MEKATAVAGSNIAFVKYWGQLDPELRLPLNGSISMTLDSATTITTVEFSDKLGHDSFILNGKMPKEEASLRVSKHLDRIRGLAGVNPYGKVESSNSFPTSTGIASSASGFAALTVAACAALGLFPSLEELSRLARLASGSACRSVFGGFVEWVPGHSHEESYARQIAPPDHWDLVDIVAVVSDEPKGIPSGVGQRLAPTSLFLSTRLDTLGVALSKTKMAILQRNLRMLGEVAETEALSIHAVMMTSSPSLLYWDRGTIALIHSIRKWRQEGLQAYFTIDAGPNVHVLTLRGSIPVVLEELRKIPEVKQTIVSGPGEDAHLVDSHLF